MSKKIYMKFIKTILSNLLFLFFIFNQQALSKPIPPGSGEGDVPANILILLDSSASMQRQIVTGDSLGFPHSIAADSNGDVYIGESSNGIVKMISADEKADQTFANSNRNFRGKKINAHCILDNNRALDILQLSSLIKDSSFVIANDTGPAHMAAHLNAKGITLFGKHTTGYLVRI